MHIQEFDVKTAFNTKLPAFPSPSEAVNTAGVNDAIDNLIKEVEEFKNWYYRKDSFLKPLSNLPRMLRIL